ncbi:MAG: ankyrin repeat domain-containing protein [Gemmatimonadaceae bacterium]|jgi:hypothetical protein
MEFDHEALWRDAHYKALWDACDAGHLLTAKRIFANYEFAPSNFKALRAFEAACGYGRLQMAKWIAEAFDLKGHVKKNPKEAFYMLIHACLCDQLEVAQWIVQFFEMDVSETTPWFDGYDLPVRTRSRGLMSVNTWLYSTFPGLPESGRSAFTWRFYVDEFGDRILDIDHDHYVLRTGNAKDLRILDNYPLRWACREGHLDVVRELLRCGLTVEDVRTEHFDALCRACINGHLPVAQLLVQTFPELTSDSMVSRKKDVLNALHTREVLGWVRANGRPDIEAWLVETFGVADA